MNARLFDWFVVGLLVVLPATDSHSMTRGLATDTEWQEREGDWIVDDVIELSDQNIRLNGNLILQAGGKLVLENCHLQLIGEFSREHTVQWSQGVLVTKNCTVGGFVNENGNPIHTVFRLFEGLWEATDTTIEYSYGVSFHWESGKGILRADGLHAGERPDAIILSGEAEVELKNSDFPIALGVYADQGGECEIEFPTREPITLNLLAQSLTRGTHWKLDLENTQVERWFLFIRNIGPEHEPCTVRIGGMQDLIVSLLGHNLTGDIQLSRDLSSPMLVGNTRLLRKDPEVAPQISMWAMYFSGDKTDAVVTGDSHICEWMQSGGSVRLQSGNEGSLSLGCTTTELRNSARLEANGVTIGRPLTWQPESELGELNLEDDASFVADRVTLHNVSVRTSDRATAKINNATRIGSLKLEGESDQIQLSYPAYPIRDVFVPGKDPYPAIRIPALASTKKGTLLAFAEGRQAGDHSENELILKRSIDFGVSWSDVRLLHSAKPKAVNNPQVVVLDSGRIIVMYQVNLLGEFRAEPGYGERAYQCMIQTSDDDGEHWTPPRDITRSVKRAETVTSIASGPGNGIVLQRGEHAGRILMPMNQGPFGDWRVYAAYSDDDGETWEMGDVAADPVNVGHSNEVQMVECEDGTILLNARSQGKGASKCRKIARSHDAGRTWTETTDEPMLIDPTCQASFCRYAWSDDGGSKLLFLNPASTTGRENGTLRVSFDEGRFWPIAKTIYPGAFAYSSMVRMQDGRIGILFERDNYGAISFTAISMEELLQK